MATSLNAHSPADTPSWEVLVPPSVAIAKPSATKPRKGPALATCRLSAATGAGQAGRADLAGDQASDGHHHQRVGGNGPQGYAHAALAAAATLHQDDEDGVDEDKLD